MNNKISAVLGAALLLCSGAYAQEGDFPAGVVAGFAGLLSLPRGGAGAGPAVPTVGPGRPQAAAGLSWDDRPVDLSSQFTGGSRHQADVGSCHTFASVAILEAAYYRFYGQRVRLAEADLFIQRNVTSRDAYMHFLQNGYPGLTEANNTGETLAFALNNGVATEPRYAAFLERYRRYRAAENATLQNLLRDYRRLSEEEQNAYNVREHWVQLQQSTTSQRIIQNFLMGNERAAIERDRALMRTRFAAFSISSGTFATTGPGNSPNQCRLDGRPQTAAIRSELEAGRPVAIAMNGHALVISGFRRGEGGAIVFSTRNSYGPESNRNIPVTQTCRILRVMSVR